MAEDSTTTAAATTTSAATAAAAEMSRKARRTLEPFHGVIYFSPIARAAYRELGVRGQTGYFASRAAAMGPVPAEVVIATFYNFHPDLVRSAIPSAWEAASPAEFLVARHAAADETLRQILGDQIDSAEMVEAAALARIAAEACPLEGRPLYAAHASLEWPERAHMQLWHAITLLREHRGDGHIAALVQAGLDGCESLVTHEAMGDPALPVGVLQSSRRWSDQEWRAAKDRLVARGLMDGDTLTAAGGELRERVEDQTDLAGAAPWRALGDARATRLRELVRPWSRAILASGMFSAG